MPIRPRVARGRGVEDVNLARRPPSPVTGPAAEPLKNLAESFL
jgi:hypothetical protein